MEASDGGRKNGARFVWTCDGVVSSVRGMVVKRILRSEAKDMGLEKERGEDLE